MYYINTKQIKEADFVKKYHFSTDPKRINEAILLDNLNANAVYLDAVSIDDTEIVPMMGVRIIVGEPFDYYEHGTSYTYCHFTSYQLIPNHIGPVDLEEFRSIVFKMIQNGDIVLG